MGYRVHIAETYKWTPVRQDGTFLGYDLSVRYSQKQGCFFNNDSFGLAEWFNINAGHCAVEGGSSDWTINLEDLESIPEDAFKRFPIEGRTEDEMRRFIAECIRCAKLTDGECHMEWF